MLGEFLLLERRPIFFLEIVFFRGCWQGNGSSLKQKNSFLEIASAGRGIAVL